MSECGSLQRRLSKLRRRSLRRRQTVDSGSLRTICNLLTSEEVCTIILALFSDLYFYIYYSL
jgi:hypothetical protein